MHVETYPAFLTPRDKRLSLSSSEEKSSEFGWLENENEMKNEREGKTEQGSVYSIYDQYYGLHIWSSSLFYSGCKGIYIEEFFQPS